MTSSPRRPRRVPSLLWTVLLVSAAAGESPRVARPGHFPAAGGVGTRRGRGLRSPFSARPLIGPDLRLSRSSRRANLSRFHGVSNPHTSYSPPPTPPTGAGGKKDT